MMYRIFLVLACCNSMLFATINNQGEKMEQSLKEFIDNFSKDIAKKSTQLNKMFWILETTGSKDAADLVAEMDVDLKLMFSDKDTYEKLVSWKNESNIQDEFLQRQLDLLILEFKQNMISKELMKKISEKESQLAQMYATYRPKLDGKDWTENDIRDSMRNETSYYQKQRVWEASKEIGNILAPKILDLVALRNEAAKELGYDNYFQMMLDLREVKEEQILSMFDDLANKSAPAYEKMSKEIHQKLIERYKISKDDLAPWAWGDVFGQEDPITFMGLDEIFKNKDLVAITKKFYQSMGFDIDPILEKSDLYEREKKNQHAFCINIDREKDVRTLNNLQSSLRWMSTLLHEIGHAVYEYGYSNNLPWLLRSPPHMIPTEAMAMLCGKQVYSENFLKDFLYVKDEDILKEAKKSEIREQLIVSRWILVMTYFEQQLYKDPTQDLNALWWSLVEKYQLIPSPKGRDNQNDWAAKYHIGLAPVYYYSYLMGEIFAAALKKEISSNGNDVWNKSAGEFLKERLFSPGDSWQWNKLIEYTLKKPLTCQAWLEEYAQE